MIYNELAFSALLQDKNKVQLKADDLFDRVINLKITCQSGQVYVIRSDFEIEFPNQAVTSIFKQDALTKSNIKYTIRKCSIKPSIKVQTKRVNSGTDVGVDIYVSNFYFFDSDGKTLRTFTANKDPIIEIKLMMGYFGQFKNMPHSSFKDLQNFSNAFGVDVITISTIEFVTTDKMPPDSVIHIHGSVGNTSGGPESKAEISDFAEIESSTLFQEVKDSTEVPKGDSFLENAFYTHITKRFARRSLGIWSIFEPDGAMTDKEAMEKGIRVFCSDGVVNFSKDRIKPVLDADDKPIESKVYFGKGSSAANTFNRINTYAGGGLRRISLNNGNWLVFTEEESEHVDKVIKKFLKTTIPEEVKNRFYDNILPAVYSINAGPVTTIIAPFFYFINPFQEIYFSSRYAITSNVDYYTDSGVNKFVATQQLISFATVEDINEMTLVCAEDK